MILQSFVRVLCYVWRNTMRYEIPTCEIVKMDVTDVISTSTETSGLGWQNGAGELPTQQVGGYDKM